MYARGMHPRWKRRKVRRNAGAPVATAAVKKVVPLADYASLTDAELSNVENVAFKRSTNQQS